MKNNINKNEIRNLDNNPIKNVHNSQIKIIKNGKSNKRIILIKLKWITKT